MSNPSPPYNPPPERPRVEPEILPPDGENMRGPRPRLFVFVDEQGRQRFATLRPPGPLAIALAVLILGAIAASVLVLVLGFVLVWIPAAILVVALLAFSGRIRGLWRRLTGGPA